jgi:hypothetical protein
MAMTNPRITTPIQTAAAIARPRDKGLGTEERSKFGRVIWVSESETFMEAGF